MLCSSATQLYTRPRQGSKRTSLAAATSQAANSAALRRKFLPAARSMVERLLGQPRCCFTRAERFAALHEVRGWLLRFAAQPSSSSGPYVVPRSSSRTIGEGEEQQAEEEEKTHRRPGAGKAPRAAHGTGQPQHSTLRARALGPIRFGLLSIIHAPWGCCCVRASAGPMKWQTHSFGFVRAAFVLPALHAAASAD